jgi:hypothetical protein
MRDGVDTWLDKEKLIPGQDRESADYFEEE